MEDDILTEAEQNLIISFNSNTEMKESVKKVLLRGIYENGVIKKGKKVDATKNWALSLGLNQPVSVSNEAIGAKLVALSEAIQFLENAFSQLSGYKKAEPAEPQTNKAI